MTSQKPPPDEGKPRHLGEDSIIILSIFSLWPVGLDWYHPLFEAVMYIALAGLVWIFYRRIKRFNEARRKT